MSVVLMALVALHTAGCADRAASPPAQGSIESIPLTQSTRQQAAQFVSLSSQDTGIYFENRFDWDNPRKNLYQHGYAGGGVCIGDYDNDNRPDIYLVSQTGRDRLYRGAGRGADVPTIV